MPNEHSCQDLLVRPLQARLQVESLFGAALPALPEAAESDAPGY